MSKKIIILVTVMTVLVACKPSTPSKYIQPEEMENLLYDFHIARSMAMNDFSSYDDQSFRKTLYWKAALQKHHVSEAQFDSSLVYYYTRADRFADMYKHVLTRLQDEAILLGATEGEIGKYASLNESGDTANIWKGSTSHLLMPNPPYHRLDFSIKDDSLFKRGDEFLLQFVSDFVFQSGVKDGVVYVAVEYPDTVVSRQTHFSFSGVNQIKLPKQSKKRPESVKGYIYLGGSDETTTVLRLLFINNIQLIRFHDKDEAKNEENSVSSVDTSQQSTAASDGSGDPVGTGGSVLSVTRGASPNRMVERIDSLKARH